MNFIGRPITIQNTDSGEWIVQMDGVAPTSSGESVSIVVALPRDLGATLPELEARAVDRAIELLEGWRANHP